MTDYRMRFVGNNILGIELIYLKIFLLPTVMLGLFLTTVFVVILPKIEQIGKFRSDFNDLSGKTKILDQKKNYLQSVDQEGLRLKDQLISQALPESKNLYFLLNVIGNLAGKYNFVVDSISLSPGVIEDKDKDQFAKNKNLVQVPVIVVLNGEAKSYVSFLREIERSLPILAISDYAMQKASSDLVSLKLTVSTYFSPRDFSKNISSVSLKDLTLSSEESKLLDTLGSYNKLNLQQMTAGSVGNEASVNTTVTRQDPFNY